MSWFTTKNGKHINTDWFEAEDQLKFKQIQANRMVAQQLSEITHSIINKPEGSKDMFASYNSYNNKVDIKGKMGDTTGSNEEYERTSKMDWIDKRIEGKKKELEKAEKKLERVKAAQASNWTKNPYWYNESDLTSTQKDIDRIKADMDKYAADMQTEIDKAKSRNVPAITNFLNDWKEKSINFYLKEKAKYNEAYKEYQDQYEEYRKWKYSEAGYNASQEERTERYKESERRRKQFKNDWLHVTQFQAGSGTWEENMRKAVEDERVRKYNDIIERTTAVTGRITDANGLKVGGKGDLNGIIEGEKGSVRLETIGAGGYNIQRFHFRTLIHEVDPEVYKKWRAEQDKKAEPAPKPLNTAQSTKNKSEQEKQSDYLINTVKRLKNKGMSSKEDVEKYVNELSDLRRYDLAKKLGVQAKGQERRQQLVDKIHKAFNESNATPDTPAKSNEPTKSTAKKEIVSNVPKNIPHKSNYGQYEDIIGERQEGSPIDRIHACQENRLINPMYQGWQNAEYYEKYHKNCALTAVAGILQAQGYDVEAMPRDPETWRGLSTIFDLAQIDPDDVVLAGTQKVDAQITYPIFKAIADKYGNDTVGLYNEWAKYERMPTNSPQAATTIRKKMKKWGNGTVAQVSVVWKGKTKVKTADGKEVLSADAHALLCVNDGGKIYLWDPQSNSKHSDIAKYLKGSKVGKTRLIRVDNLPLKDGIQEDLKKMVKKRDTNNKSKSLNEAFEEATKGIDWSKF